ncbi:MAG: hypothetical protein HY329_03025 [Chloroflexi bacterium]|nr:hypothetical protein [Chloroflexota bacterium]
MTFRRVDPEEVVAAFEKTGLTPVRKRWLSEDQACGLCALLASRLGRDQALEVSRVEVFHARHIARLLELKVPYVLGFIDGWDNALPWLIWSAAYRGGYSDGRAAARELGLA